MVRGQTARAIRSGVHLAWGYLVQAVALDAVGRVQALAWLPRLALAR